MQPDPGPREFQSSTPIFTSLEASSSRFDLDFGGPSWSSGLCLKGGSPRLAAWPHLPGRPRIHQNFIEKSIKRELIFKQTLAPTQPPIWNKVRPGSIQSTS